MAVWLVLCGMHGEDEAWDWEPSLVDADWCPRNPLKSVGAIGGSTDPGG